MPAVLVVSSLFLFHCFTNYDSLYYALHNKILKASCKNGSQKLINDDFK